MVTGVLPLLVHQYWAHRWVWSLRPALLLLSSLVLGSSITSCPANPVSGDIQGVHPSPDLENQTLSTATWIHCVDHHAWFWKCAYPTWKCAYPTWNQRTWGQCLCRHPQPLLWSEASIMNTSKAASTTLGRMSVPWTSQMARPMAVLPKMQLQPRTLWLLRTSRIN